MDGCFNIRTKRGATSMSIHAWALAIDIMQHGMDLEKLYYK